MKLAICSLSLFVLAAVPLPAGSFSYVVLQDSEQDSLVRVSADGKSVTTIANGAPGVGLAADSAGNYVVAARSKLLRVTRSGETSTIAQAPAGAEWVTVAADRKGSLIVADAKDHVIWRVSEDGQTVVRVAQYPGTLPPGGAEIGLLVDTSGDYLLLRSGDDDKPHFYGITPAGGVSRIPLTGAVSRVRLSRAKRDGTEAVSGGAIIPDGSGNYVFHDYHHNRGVFRLSATGVVTRLAVFPDVSCCPKGLAMNPETGEIILLGAAEMLRAGADGSRPGTFTRHSKITRPTAVIVDSRD